MSEPNSPVAIMCDEECWERLRSTPIGRVAMSLGNEVEIFPVNYEVKDDAIFLRTAEGTKLFGIAIGKPVALEIDGWDDKQGWSVIAKCTARMLDHEEEKHEADDLELDTWVPTRKNVIVKLTPSKVSGRLFTFGDEPDDPWK